HVKSLGQLNSLSFNLSIFVINGFFIFPYVNNSNRYLYLQLFLVANSIPDTHRQLNGGFVYHPLLLFR
ncbi:MAG: hypothetical protein PSV35_08185, partial [bacterium]|nr:hypothetical protein [bacterium]